MAKVFLNPGHCPDVDSGAVNYSYGVTEAAIVKEVGDMVADYLRKAGCEVELLQSDNLAGENPNYPNVCASANNWPADVFVSLHCNAAASEQANGTECFVFSHWSKSDRLAACIQSQIVHSLGTSDRGVKVSPKLIVLHNTTMPAVLVELAFISNDADCEKLIDQKRDFAAAVARGVTDFLTERGE